MRIGIIGAGRIGGTVGRRLALAGHEIVISARREPDSLRTLAAQIGPGAVAGRPAEAVAFAEVVLLAVPWAAIPDALERAGSLAGRIVIDTANRFGPAGGRTAAAANAARMPGARYTKSFNALTAAFQAAAAERTGSARVVQWLCGDDGEAKELVSGLIAAAGYVPVDLGGTAAGEVMEAPRRPGAVYGEEYRAADATAVLEAVRAGRPIPPAPRYQAP